MATKKVTIDTLEATLMRAEPYTMYFAPDEMPELAEGEYLEAEMDVFGNGTLIRRVCCPNVLMIKLVFDFYLNVGPCKLKWFKMKPECSVKAVFVNVSDQ